MVAKLKISNMGILARDHKTPIEINSIILMTKKGIYNTMKKEQKTQILYKIKGEEILTI